MAAPNARNWRAGLSAPAADAVVKRPTPGWKSALAWRASGLALTLLCIAAAAPATLLIREQAWTAPGDDLAYDMTHAPYECLATQTPETEIGRALFRSPALFGGPAARLGLSCNACHTSGRANGRFFLPELTNRAGAADVTSEWASKVRGDGVMNPVTIPDLAGATARASFGRAHEPSLEHFIGSVIGEEFQGPAPPDQAFHGVIAYVRALAPCPERDNTLTLEDAANDVRRALTAAQGADAPTASLVLLAAQDGLGRIVERLPRHSFLRDRNRLESLARELGAMRTNTDPRPALEAALPGWMARYDAAITQLAPRERDTYFNETTLAQALKTQ
jgi:mono/diheme cytochrome c family protein